jgi:hypothetical protein
MATLDISEMEIRYRSTISKAKDSSLRIFDSLSPKRRFLLSIKENSNRSDKGMSFHQLCKFVRMVTPNVRINELKMIMLKRR